MGFPGGSGKESACNAEDPGSVSGLRRSPGEGHGNPLQYSCLETPLDRGASWVIVHKIAESDTTEATWSSQAKQLHKCVRHGVNIIFLKIFALIFVAFPKILGKVKLFPKYTIT